MLMNITVDKTLVTIITGNRIINLYFTVSPCILIH